MTDRYAVFGNPIAHSKSPLIHSLFAEQTGEDISYTAELVATDGFERAVREFISSGGCGLNITVPFKLEAHDLSDELSDRARLAGAVNTLSFDGDRILGENTDGIGILRDIQNNHGITLEGRRILIIGAGGAVRGTLQPLLDASPSGITIANRTVSRAKDLATTFSGYGEIAACGYADLKGNAFDLIINGTSASLTGDLPPLPEDVLREGGFCYDMMYGARPTVFMEWGMERNYTCADGLGMLVEQAAESFRIWRGVQPETTPVIEAVRSAL